MAEIEWTNADGEAEIVARALTLVSLVRPAALEGTDRGRVVVPRAAIAALRDACEKAYPGSIGRVRASVRIARTLGCRRR